MNSPEDCGVLNQADARRAPRQDQRTLTRVPPDTCTRCDLANNSWGPGAPPACNDELPHTWETL
jgi:hypothetical protein